MSEPLHYLKSYVPDPVTGAFETRCGIKGYRDGRPFPRVEHEGKAIVSGGVRYLTADHEMNVTCRQCKLKVRLLEKKVLRVMLDHESTTRECKFDPNHSRFDFSVGTGIYFYGPSDLRAELIVKGLIKPDAYKINVLTNEGRLLAQTYPKVPDPFDKPRRKRK